jgi:vanillate O-demethylase monooxygenase subunit
MVFFRGTEGLTALEDFCPHRGALSLGFVREGVLVCGYHGLAVGCTGKVSHMPGQRVGGFPRATLCGGGAPWLHLGLARRGRDRR